MLPFCVANIDVFAAYCSYCVNIRDLETTQGNEPMGSRERQTMLLSTSIMQDRYLMCEYMPISHTGYMSSVRCANKTGYIPNYLLMIMSVTNLIVPILNMLNRCYMSLSICYMSSSDEYESLYYSSLIRPAYDPVISLPIETLTQDLAFSESKKPTPSERLSRDERVFRRTRHKWQYFIICVNNKYTYAAIDYLMLQTAYLISILDDK